MVQEFLPLLPAALTSAQVLVCVAALLLGIFLWLTGATWSRGLVTLMAVTLGAALGTYVPRWQLWPVNSMAAGVLGAVGFGLTAFLIERLWVGLTLAFVLTCWATFATWMLCRPADFVWPERADYQVQHLTPPQHAEDVYDRLPDEMQNILPYAAATTVLSGLALAALWPRVGRVVCFSALGMTTIFVFGLALLATQRAEWLRYIPAPLVSQVGMMAGLVMVGVLAQWPFSGRRASPHARHEQLPPGPTDAERQLSRMFSS